MGKEPHGYSPGGDDGKKKGAGALWSQPGGQYNKPIEQAEAKRVISRVGGEAREHI